MLKGKLLLTNFSMERVKLRVLFVVMSENRFQRLKALEPGGDETWLAGRSAMESQPQPGTRNPALIWL